MTRILVAEDFDIIREDLCDTLNAQSDMCVVGQASSGAEITALAGSEVGRQPGSGRLQI